MLEFLHVVKQNSSVSLSLSLSLPRIFYESIFISCLSFVACSTVAKQTINARKGVRFGFCSIHKCQVGALI